MSPILWAKEEKIFPYNYILKYQRIFSLPLATESRASSILHEALCAPVNPEQVPLAPKVTAK